MLSALQIIASLLGAFAILGFLIYTIKKSEDPGGLTIRWILTIPVLGALFFVVGPIVDKGGYSGAFVGIPGAAVCGVFLMFIWHRTLSDLASKPFTCLYDGGREPPTPQPAYSTARAFQKQGKFQAAVSEVLSQLQQFPTDVEGHFLLAEIQAENLRDLPAAERTIERFIGQPGHHPKNIAFALYSMADWHMAVSGDKEFAKAWLQRIIEILPDTEFALGAAQRIAHVESPEAGPLDPKKYSVLPGSGVAAQAQRHEIPEAGNDEAVRSLAQKYARHLEVHPLDTEVREKLAVIYAEEYSRLDLAIDQLEQMIQQPNQPAKNIVRWLNTMADLQVRHGGSYDDARASLQRIIDQNPGGAAAEVARNRLSKLKLEFKAVEQSEVVKMGTYDQNIGLKGVRRMGPPL